MWQQTMAATKTAAATGKSGNKLVITCKNYMKPSVFAQQPLMNDMEIFSSTNIYI